MGKQSETLHLIADDLAEVEPLSGQPAEQVSRSSKSILKTVERVKRAKRL